MALGQGLGALFEDNSVNDDSGVQLVRLSEIEPNKLQPRKSFDEAAIQSLAESIREHGLIQPITVRRIDNGMGYQIVAGERRWRACRMLGLDEVSVIIKDIDDFHASQIALIENIQREDLNPIEEAAAFKELMQTYGMTQDKLSKTIGRSRSAIANSLRLLSLPERVQQLLIEGRLTNGHGKALAGIEDEELMISLAEKAADGQLSVRQIEKNASDAKKAAVDVNIFPEEDAPDKSLQNFYTEMEISLSNRLGRRIRIHPGFDGRGELSLDFFSKDDLIALADMLTHEE